MIVFAWLGNSNFAGEMALFADAVPLSRRELCGIQHWRSRSDVVASWPVASLAGYAAFAEWRGSIGVLCGRNALSAARMAFEASREDGPRQIWIVDTGISRRGLP